jgi:hypothetical protein
MSVSWFTIESAGMQRNLPTSTAWVRARQVTRSKPPARSDVAGVAPFLITAPRP